MQCKDIPDAPVLAYLLGLDASGSLAGWHDLKPRAAYMPTVLDAMPSGTPGKLALAKMAMLKRRGLVDGCCCGCRGEFRITGKGRATLSVLSRGIAP